MENNKLMDEIDKIVWDYHAEDIIYQEAIKKLYQSHVDVACAFEDWRRENTHAMYRVVAKGEVRPFTHYSVKQEEQSGLSFNTSKELFQYFINHIYNNHG